MGHQSNTYDRLISEMRRDWLFTLPGWWAEPEASGELPYGEFEWGGGRPSPTSARWHARSVCPDKYSGLISEHASPVAWVARFEDWLSETLPGVRVVRLDELLRLEWEAQAGRPWEKILDPSARSRRWLPSHEYRPAYFRLLPAE